MEHERVKEDFGLLWKQVHARQQAGCNEDTPDVLRTIMGLTECGQSLNIFSPDCGAQIMKGTSEKYAQCVKPHTTQNMNRTWKWSLNIESAANLPCVQNFIKECKREEELLLPPHKKDQPIFLSQPANINTGATLSTAPKSKPVSEACGVESGGRTHTNRGSLWSLGSTDNHSMIKDEQHVPTPAIESPATLADQHRLSAQPPSMFERDQLDTAHPQSGCFKTAKQQLIIDNQKKFGRDKSGGGGGQGQMTYGTSKKSLGTRRGPASRFVPPVLTNEEDEDSSVPGAGTKSGTSNKSSEEPTDERLKNIDAKMVELIMSEIMDHGPTLVWDDIAGLEFAKKTIKEIVIWPMLRPDIFTGLRGPPKGLMLFGPPGTGKTLIGKCIASQSKSTFFSISASSLTSKWVGEGEKMVRALFAVARVHQPAVVFIDEVDSLLGQRSDTEHESSRRIKTEFLVQLDGATTGEDDRILIIGATNRPHEIDEAARRRFVKRLYIPLPEPEARQQIVCNLLANQKHQLTDTDLKTIADKSDGYSGADMANLCREAALGPIRSMPFSDIEHISADQVKPIMFSDFEAAFQQVRASVSEKDLDLYLDWNKQYGSWGH